MLFRENEIEFLFGLKSVRILMKDGMRSSIDRFIIVTVWKDSIRLKVWSQILSIGLQEDVIDIKRLFSS